MACDPNALMEAAKCYECIGGGRMFDALEIVLLCAIRDGTTMSCDPQSLIDQTACIFNCIPPGAMSAIKISLLCNIANGT